MVWCMKKIVFDAPQKFMDFERFTSVMQVLGFVFIGRDFGKITQIAFKTSKTASIKTAERIAEIFYPKKKVTVGEMVDMIVIVLEKK